MYWNPNRVGDGIFLLWYDFYIAHVDVLIMSQSIYLISSHLPLTEFMDVVHSDLRDSIKAAEMQCFYGRL